MADTLRGTFDALKKSLGDNLESKVSKKLQALEECIKAQENGTRTIESFLGSVSDSAISAQSALRGKNMDQVSAAVALNEEPPGIFVMPKLHAEIRFAMEAATGDSFLMRFFGKDETEKTSSSQMMSFDLVSIPPSPEFIQSASTKVRRLSSVLSPYTRTKVMELFADPAAWTDAASTLIDEDRRKTCEASDQILMLSEINNPDAPVMLLLVEDNKGGDTAPRVGVWIVDRSKRKVREVWGLDDKQQTPRNVDRLREWALVGGNKKHKQLKSNKSRKSRK